MRIHRFDRRRDRERAVAGRGRRRSFQLESLEDRRLLTSVVFADGFSSKTGTVLTESVTLDNPGYSYITGSLAGTAAIGGTTLKSSGLSDVYIAKVDGFGNVIWVKSFGSNFAAVGDYGRSVAVDNNGFLYLTGVIAGPATIGGISVPNAGSSDILVAKFDVATGNAVWARTFGGAAFDEGQDVAVDAAGNVYLTGGYQGTAQFDGVTLTSAGGRFDAFVAKLDSQGNTLWAKSAGGTDYDEAFSLSVDAAGNIFTTGVFSDTATFGTTSLTSAGETDVFVMKMDNAGTVSWVQGYGYKGHDDGTGVENDGAGGVYFTGDMVGNVQFGPFLLINATVYGPGATDFNDAFVGHLDAAGNVTWAHNFGGGGKDAGFSITKDTAGNVYNTGNFSGLGSFPWLGPVLLSKGDADAYIVKMDPSGNVLSAQAFGSTSADQAWHIAVGGPSQNVTAVGNYTGAVNLHYDGQYPTASFLGYNGLAKPGAIGGYIVQFAPWSNTNQSSAPSDFDALGHSQLAYYNPSTQEWWVRGQFTDRLMGTFGINKSSQIPVAGDYQGVGRTQLAVYDMATGDWWLNGPGGPQYLGTFGDPASKDIPVPGDYQNVGHDQLAVYRPATGQWFLKTPQTAPGWAYLGVFGDPSKKDIPVPADYNGDGVTELAVYRPSTGQWFIQTPSGPSLMGVFGQPNLATGYADVPIPGQYDGLGYAQPAVYRPTTAAFLVWRASGNFNLGIFGSGYFYDLPTQAAAGSLVWLGRLPNITASGGGGGAALSLAATGTGSGPSRSAAGQTRSFSVDAPAAQSKVVSRQGDTADDDAVSAAIEQLYDG